MMAHRPRRWRSITSTLVFGGLYLFDYCDYVPRLDMIVQTYLPPGFISTDHKRNERKIMYSVLALEDYIYSDRLRVHGALLLFLFKIY